MTLDVSLLAAFAAGVLSISSPCVLPLVPLYLTHLAGVSAAETGPPKRRLVLANAAAYVLGFSVVFVLVGVALGAAGALVSTGSVVAEHRYWLVRFGGALLVILGLQQIGLIRVPFLAQDRRLLAHRVPTGHLTSSFVVGASFGAGWSPCAGPILGAILTMAAGQGDPERAAVLLTAYSGGLAVPFFVAALFGTSAGVIRRLAPRLQTLTTIAGSTMLAVGTIMILGIYEQIFVKLAAIVPWTPWEPRI
ncbi:MAG: cytochrome c-type biosis protein [Thermomicrobiales bacterium]|jgi:cytochrome c-type biogenesis protein|nr:cytochrome c-type biosis protein [Thermomicrobiales bacterium]MEA2525543.1 cytochrome c-type biosis protein [Thermomicrobiales bacterium]